MKVIIAGSTGMVGRLILEQCIASDKVTQIITLVRRKHSDTIHPKVNEVQIADFTNYSDHADLFQNVDAAFFCIGVYTGQVNDDLFKTITVDYSVELAKAVHEHSKNARYCLLSGAGADRTEKSRTSFARYKGMSENQIAELGLSFHSFRPAYIYPVTKRKEPNAMYRISRMMYPLIKLFGNNMSIKSTELAQAMFQVGIQGTDLEILENKDILEIISQ